MHIIDPADQGIDLFCMSVCLTIQMGFFYLGEMVSILYSAYTISCCMGLTTIT